MSGQLVRTVFLALHYQNEVVHPQGRIRLGVAAHDPARDAFIAAALRLHAGARSHAIPIVFVRIAFASGHAEVVANAEIWRRVVAGGLVQEGTWGSAFAEGLGPREGEIVVTHQRNNAFYASPLELVVNRLEARRLVIAGVATNFSVESTVRHASDAGYDVVVAADACSAGSATAHQASLASMAMLARVASVDEILGEWARAS